MIKLMLAPTIQPEMQALLKGKYEIYDMTGYARPADIPNMNPAEIRAVVTKGESIFTAEMIADLPNLEIISNYGVGYDGTDAIAAKKQGAIVTHTPDVLTDETANTSLLLTLAVTRKLLVLDKMIRAGGWPSEPKELLANSIVEKVCGIVGLGRIGRGVARRLEACGAKIAYSDPVKQDDVPYDYYPDAKSLAKASDVLVVACMGGAATRRMINAEVLDALGPEGFLVNAARGTIVDEPALIQALEEKRIAGAGLDVFENEPHVPEAFWGMDNVVLMPHRGSATHETRGRMAGLCAANLESYFAGKGPITPVPEMKG